MKKQSRGSFSPTLKSSSSIYILHINNKDEMKIRTIGIPVQTPARIKSLSVSAKDCFFDDKVCVCKLVSEVLRGLLGKHCQKQFANLEQIFEELIFSFVFKRVTICTTKHFYFSFRATKIAKLSALYNKEGEGGSLLS